MKYEKRFHDGGEPIECDCCGYPAAVADFEKRIFDQRCGDSTEMVALCEVCSSTSLGSSVLYLSHYDRQGLYGSIGWVVNKLLEEIRRLDRDKKDRSDGA